MRCANCETELLGEYCHACGQHRLENADLSLSPVLRHFGDELLRFDFKTLRSLAALFKPGFLTSEFYAGRRRTYLSPLKLYFLSAGIFFLAAPFVGFSLTELLANDERGALRALVDGRRQQVSMSAELFEERFDARVQTVFTFALSVSVIASALLLRVLYRRRTLGAHLVFSLHYVSFLYVGALAMAAFHKSTGLRGPVLAFAITYAILFPYLFIALRRVHRESVRQTLLKVFAVCAVTFLVDSIVNVGAFMLTLWLI